MTVGKLGGVLLTVAVAVLVALLVYAWVDGGREPVWFIAPQNELEAAFYRNSLIDAFLETSLVELALAHAARAESHGLEAFWDQVMRLRTLLKFDFYFADSAGFREHVAEEMSWQPNWEEDVTAGGDRIDAVLRAKRPAIAGPLLRPFFEAYWIVADVLVDAPADSVLFRGLDPDTRFYFVHSYAAQQWEGDPSALLTWATHHVPFLAAVETGALSATQFHPEKSGDAGAELLSNWIGALS